MTSKEQIRLSNAVAPSFREMHRDIKRGGHTHYWLPGGRGSTKSSFVGIEIPLGIMRDEKAGEITNAVVLRRYGVTLRDSVFAQILWGLHVLGVSHLWRATVSPLALTYKKSGQQILFRGADDPMKVKSIKVPVGYIKYAWYEEVNEFEGEEKIRSLNQSLMRGGRNFAFFYTFNPPPSSRNWCNQYVSVSHPGTMVVHSTYLTVPREWLGEPFIVEAEHLKETKPTAYAHEYLGEVTGTGGEVFDNVNFVELPDEVIDRFDRIRRRAWK